MNRPKKTGARRSQCGTIHEGMSSARINPDGSEQRVVYGVSGTIDVPGCLSINPDLFEPTPWEAYTYDANDNAGRTHPAVAVSYHAIIEHPLQYP